MNTTLARAAAVLLLALAPLAAHAHVTLKESTPARESTVAESPPQVKLAFAQRVELTALTIAGAGEKSPKALGPLPSDPTTHFSVPLPKLASGDYTISYTVIGSDLHEMTGTIRFKVAAPR